MTTAQTPMMLPRRLHPYILGIAFLSTYYVALLGPILPTLAEPLGGGALAIGLLFSSYSLAQFLTAPVLGALGDRFGRRVVLIISITGAILGFSIFTVGVVSGAGLWLLFVGWIIAGASDCWVATAFSYIADRTEPEDRTRLFSYLIAAIGAAFIVGPATSGLFSAAGPATPLFVLLGLLVAALLWGYLAMPESLPSSRRATGLRASRMNPLSQIREILQFPQLRLLLLSYLLFWPSVIALTASLPSLLADRGAWSPAQISSVLFIFGALVVVVQLGVIPLLVRRFRELSIAMTGTSLAVVAFALFAVFPSTEAAPLIYVGIVLFGLGQPLVQTCLTGAMSKSMAADIQGRVQGSVAATMALAQVIGPAAAGWLYGAVSPSAPYWATSILLVTAMAFMFMAVPQLKRLGRQSHAVTPEPSRSSA